MKGGVDVIGARLDADDAASRAAQRAEQPERQRRLAAARARRGDHEAAGQRASPRRVLAGRGQATTFPGFFAAFSDFKGMPGGKFPSLRPPRVSTCYSCRPPPRGFEFFAVSSDFNGLRGGKFRTAFRRFECVNCCRRAPRRFRDFFRRFRAISMVCEVENFAPPPRASKASLWSLNVTLAVHRSYLTAFEPRSDDLLQAPNRRVLTRDMRDREPGGRPLQNPLIRARRIARDAMGGLGGCRRMAGLLVTAGHGLSGWRKAMKKTIA